MTNVDERAKRLHKANLRLGGAGAKCGTCGFENPLCLEDHHVAGRKYDSQTTPICRNCHRILSDMQKDHSKPMGPTPGLLEQIVHFLEGAADMLELLVQMMRRLASELYEKLSSKAVIP